MFGHLYWPAPSTERAGPSRHGAPHPPMITPTWLAGVTLAAPDASWTDRSMVVFAAPSAPGDMMPANVSLARDERRGPTDPAQETLEAYAQRQLQTLAAALPAFKMLRQGRLGDSSPEVRELLFSWRSGATPLTQWLVWQDIPDGTVVNFTATATTPRFDDQLPHFEAALRSLVLDPTRFPPPAPR